LAGAGLLARFSQLAPLFIQLGLFPAGLTGFLIPLLLLLLAGLLPAAALLTASTALLVLLIALIGHQFTPCCDVRINAALSKNVPAPT